MLNGLSKFMLIRELIVAFGIAAAVYAVGFGALNVMQSVLAEEGSVLDCPGRIFGLYCDCAERDLGLYCSEDPSPEENPNENSSGNGGGGGGGGEESQPAPKVGKVLAVATSSCSARTKDSKAKGFIVNKHVPAVIARLFKSTFGKTITPAESNYWKTRARCDKPTEAKLKGAMEFHKLKGQTMPK